MIFAILYGRNIYFVKNVDPLGDDRYLVKAGKDDVVVKSHSIFAFYEGDFKPKLPSNPITLFDTKHPIESLVDVTADGDFVTVNPGDGKSKDSIAMFRLYRIKDIFGRTCKMYWAPFDGLLLIDPMVGSMDVCHTHICFCKSVGDFKNIEDWVFKTFPWETYIFKANKKPLNHRPTLFSERAYAITNALSKKHGTTVPDLAAKTGFSKDYISPRLYELEKAGRVRKEEKSSPESKSPSGRKSRPCFTWYLR